MLNHIVMHGRLVRDPELRYTQSGTPVASFTVAVNRDVASQDGTRAADYIDCVAWRSTAEFISRNFTKGSAAIVSGRLQQRDWTDKEGNKRRSFEVVVDSIYFGESKKQDQGATDAPRGGFDGFGGGAPVFNPLPDVDDGELPF